MKPENKIPVLDNISDEMKSVVNFHREDLPPCFIAGAEFDPLIDDSRLLFQTLQAHQQPCQYKMYPGTLHAFLHYSRMMKTADDALREGARYFRAQL